MIESYAAAVRGILRPSARSGRREVKGINEPVKVYEVTGVGPLRTHFQLAARRGLTKFVGREAELAQVKRALDLALSGHGQVVAVVAEAGTGKSRLVYEFKTTLPAECKLLEAYSVSHGKASAWLPVLELLHTYFGIEGVDDPPMRRGKLSSKLAMLDQRLSDTLPYLFGLLGIQESPIRSPRWTRRSGAGARSKRSSESCCARR